MKASDYIVDFLVTEKARTVFLITGGAIAHVVDSVGRRKEERGDIDFVAVQHEQSGAMAAEAYSRLATEQGLGVMMATSGPGATNLITGMCGCWFDSIPALFITGQVNTKEAQTTAKTLPRQVGFQETDIVSIAKPITKYSVQVTDPKMLRYELEKAVAIARSGRPGPVLVDVPVDLQVVDLDPHTMKGFVADEVVVSLDSAPERKTKLSQALTLIQDAERPVLLLGGGVRLARAEGDVLALVEKLGIPTVVSWSGFDLIPHDHPLFAGHIGVYGNRAGNFVVQNADLLLSIGSRLDTRQTGGRVETFARAAKKIMVDIDTNEINKGRGLSIDVGIVADAKMFITECVAALAATSLPDISAWKGTVSAWKKAYGGSVEKGEAGGPMNSYDFLSILSEALPENQVTIADEGGNLVWTMQSFKVKKGQRVISTFGNSPMGYALPAAIGAATARKGESIICIDGDGGFQMNIQELQTLVHYQLPVKVFIMNNRSMGIIKQFQDLYFGSRYIATTEQGGYTSPNFAEVAKAYGLTTFTVSSLTDAQQVISQALATPGPVLVDVLIDEDQKLSPKLEFGRPIEDMAPYLDRKELAETMIIDLLPESKTLPENKGWVTLK